jgi:ferrous-iron efflux pump FieF
MTLDPNKADKLKKLAASSSISLAIALCLLKALAVFYTDSLAVLSSMVDSLSDIFASLITFIAIRVSTRPATCTYRYGYGKAEALSSLFQAVFVASSGFFILYDAAMRLQHHIILQQTTFGLITMIISLILTLILVAFQQWVAKVTMSQAILADSLHYRVDIMTNSSIIISLAVIHFWKIYWIDSAIAVAISVYLLYNAYDLGRDAVRLLLDKELSNEIRDSIFQIVAKHPLSPKIHDLRTHDLGGAYMFEFHLELDGNLDLYTAHKYTEEIENLILQTYPTAQVLIHQDPLGVQEERLDNRLIGASCPLK